MIYRIWHGWTTAQNGPAYAELLRSTVFPGIAAKGIRGYRGIELITRELPGGEREFVTIMRFDSIDDVRAFAGDDYERAYVPEVARRLLARWDDRSAHYELLESAGQ
jgi:antibiotic biosynthesis monooxygenase (ABM) superfamily enzyme